MARQLIKADRNRTNCIFPYTYIGVVITLLVTAWFVVCVPQSVSAAEPYDYSKSTAMQTPCSFTSGSGILSPEGAVFRESCTPALLANFIATLVKFLLRLTIALAVLMVVIGGFQWLMAMGNSGKISNAKETVQQALIGLILAFVSYLLFLQIDQSFVLLKSLDVTKVSLNRQKCREFSFDPKACVANESCYWKCQDEDEQKNQGSDPKCPGFCLDRESAYTTATCNDNNALIAQYNGIPGDGKQESPALKSLIACVLANPAARNLIDEAQLYTYERNNPKCNFTRGTPVCGSCAHSQYSCHYGPNETGAANTGSEAVDFNAKQGVSETTLFDALKPLEGPCKFGLPPYFEKDHTHVITENCHGGSDVEDYAPQP